MVHRKVGDVMTTGVATTTPIAPLKRAVDHPWRRRLRRRRRALSRARSVGELMTSPVHTVDAGVPIAEAAQVFAHLRVNQLPVTDHGELAGIVSRIDLLRVFLRSDRDIAHDVETALARGFDISITPATIQVSVLNGVVTLRGKVETKSAVPIAVALARAVDGVVDVECALGFERDNTHDPKLRLPDDDVTVEGGWSNR